MQDFLYATFLWLHMLVLRHWIFLLPNGFKLHVRLQVLFTDSQALGNCWSNFCKWSRLFSWESEGIIMLPPNATFPQEIAGLIQGLLLSHHQKHLFLIGTVANETHQNFRQTWCGGRAFHRAARQGTVHVFITLSAATRWLSTTFVVDDLC